MGDLEHVRTPALDELVGIAAANYDAAQLAYLAEGLARAAGAAFLREDGDGLKEPPAMGELRHLHGHPRASQPPRFGS